MPYNISVWKTREITDLRVPLAAVQELEEVKVILQPGKRVNVEWLPEGFELTGTLDDGWIAVETLESWGEISGTMWEPLQELLQQSRGTLRARLVWEAGDTIEELTVIDGDVQTVEI